MYIKYFSFLPPLQRVSRYLVPLSVFLVLSASLVRAAFVETSDNFSTAGSLTGSTPDTGVGNWTSTNNIAPSLQVSGGKLAIVSQAGEAAQLNFSSADLATGTYYMGFTLTMGTIGSIATSDTIQAVAGFRTGTPAGGTFALSFGVFRPTPTAQSFSSIPNTATDQVAVGIFTSSSLNATTTDLAAWATPLQRSASYRVVIGLDTDTDTAQLWIDPINAASSSISVSSAALVRGAFFREGGASHGDLMMENLTVSQTFALAAAIPEPATSAALFGAAAALAACVRRTRKRGGG